MDRSVAGSRPARPTAGSRPAARGHLLALLRRRRRLLITLVVLGLLAVAAGVVARPVRYTATSSVLVTHTGVDDAAVPANGQGNSAGVNMETEAELVKSVQVAALLDRPLPGRVAVEIPTSTSILRISYTARSAGGAQRGAQAYATAYLEHRRAAAATSLKNQVTSVARQITSLRGQLQATVKTMSGTSISSPTRAFTQAQADVLTSQIAVLTDRQSALSSTTITPGQVLVHAEVPAAPDGPSPILLVPVAALMVLAGAFAAALLRDRWDRRVHTAATTERRTGVPVLLNLARLPQLDFDGSNRVAGYAMQEFRRAHSMLSAALPAGRRVVLVTSATTGRSGRVLAANLAGALGRAGSSALLLGLDPADADPDGGPGAAEVLAAERELEPLLRPVPGAEAAKALAPGADATLLASRLQSPSAGALLTAARDLADWVVVHVAPVTTSADAHTLARWADAVIVVAETGRADQKELQLALGQLRDVGVERLACALVPAEKQLAHAR